MLEARVGIEPQIASYLLDLQNLEDMKSVEIVSICRIPYNYPYKIGSTPHLIVER
jgi:hypothetical protein